MEFLIQLRSVWARLAVSLALIAASLVASLILDHFHFAHSLFVLGAGVTFCALFGGFWFAMLASGASLVFQNFFFQYPLYSFAVESRRDLVELMVFLLVALVVSWAGGSLRAAYTETEQARRKAEIATRARDALLAVVSHDLKNPILAIQMGAEVLQKGGGDVTRLSTSIRRSADQMSSLIRDLLDLEKLDRGHLELDLGELTADSLLSEAMLVMTPLAEAKQQRLVLASVPPRLPPIRGDKNNVVRVLLNLIGNAVKFTRRQGSIELSAEEDVDGVRFTVTDTGPGIPAADLPHVFDRYWQARDTARLGSGLGLSISSAIVLAHGGRIWAESDFGHGSAFHFVLPSASSSPARGLSRGEGSREVIGLQRGR